MARIRTMYDQLRTSHGAMNDNNLRREFSEILKSVVGTSKQEYMSILL
jgi:hypothetical protein